jgi:hypothetical protein
MWCSLGRLTFTQGYLRWHAAPDRRAEDEARLVGEVGAWIGEHVLAEQRTACYWFAALMLAVSTANISFGRWEMTIASSASPRT